MFYCKYLTFIIFVLNGVKPMFRMATYISFTVVGMRFLDKKHVFKTSDDIWLQPDNNNPHDPSAVRVMIGNKHVAYVTRTDCPKIRHMILRGFNKAMLVQHFPNSAVLTLLCE
ncbi:HIRAN domain-containing protein [European chub iridovirus]|nr:HIRAN domain-containing protein [European chub iridovirus]